MESKREVGSGPSQRLLQTHLPWGWGNEEPSQKSLLLEDMWPGTKKTFVRKASKPKKMEVSSHKIVVCGAQAGN